MTPPVKQPRPLTPPERHLPSTTSHSFQVFCARRSREETCGGELGEEGENREEETGGGGVENADEQGGTGGCGGAVQPSGHAEDGDIFDTELLST